MSRTRTATATVVTVMGSRRRGYKTAARIGGNHLATHIEIECDNGVLITVHPDGTVGRKNWNEGMPRLSERGGNLR